MAAILSLAFFLSGAAALVFEALWLRRAGLLLGNSVWASSIVLAAFMTGLAIGNALAARWAARIARPLRVYAVLELGVAVVGATVVIATPALAPLVAPLFRRLGGAATLINVLRLAVAFVLVLLPTTAMGLTLPILVRGLARDRGDFGRVLGRLYGWNTLGGVAGAVGGELWLVAHLGVRGTAMAAAGLNLLAAILAWRVSRGAPPQEATPHEASAGDRPEPRAPRLLAAAFLSGAGLLALEVIWFRFLQLFLYGTTLTFAFMLAVILLAVGCGGLLASAWLRRDPTAHRWLAAAAGVAAVATTVSYAVFSPWYRGAAFFISQPDATLALSLRLMLATSLVSGILFTLQGAALRRTSRGAGETAGRLTLANTLGAMTGALAAGFLLLPLVGMERSILVVVIGYGGVAALSAGPRRTWLASLAAVAICLLAFPRGAMLNRHLSTSASRFLDAGTRVVAVREGTNQTTTLLRSEWKRETLSHRLLTNGHSMSATDLADRRYMKMFVYWAVAVNPHVRRALLISYGLGSTAKALTDTRALTDIDVVDVSPEILALAPMVFPDPTANPLRDPRVRVHVEDGRFFLQTTGASFDLITGEPPPPKSAGIVNLYSREYFALLRDRLREGGVATYWLPVEELDEDDARAIVRGFCSAFTNCSLWTGAGPHWMLAGTRGPLQPATEDEFTAQWRDPVVGAEMLGLGIEQPEQLGATFLADAEQLAAWIADSPPLDDDHPQRLGPGRPHPERQHFIERWMDVTGTADRFERSRLVQALWPPELRARTGALFPTQRWVNAVSAWPLPRVSLEDLHALLAESTLQTLPLLALGSSPLLQEISQRAWASGDRPLAVEAQIAIGVLVSREYAVAAVLFGALAAAGGPEAAQARAYQSLALRLGNSL